MNAPLRILVVDDSLSMRIIATALVTNLGHQVVGDANNCNVALQKYHDLRPDVVILDLLMPLFDGKETLQKLIEIDPNANIVVCSSLASERDIEFCLREGARFYLKKPYDEAGIKNVLNCIALQSALQV